MNVLYTCEFALLMGGEGLLGLLLELLGSSRAGTVPLLRLQRPREALEQRAPCNTSTFTFFSFDSELSRGARLTWCQVSQNYIFLSFDGWHFNFICKFVHKLVINQLYPNPIPPTQNQNIWPETTVKELFSYFLFPSEPVILHY